MKTLKLLGELGGVITTITAILVLIQMFYYGHIAKNPMTYLQTVITTLCVFTVIANVCALGFKVSSPLGPKLTKWSWTVNIVGYSFIAIVEMFFRC